MEIELQNKKNKQQQQPEVLNHDEDLDKSIDEYNEEQEKIFISRSQLIQNLRFPESTKKRQVVLPNNEGLGFRLDCYKEEILEGKLSEKEFRDNIYELTKICSLEFAKKLHRERTDPFTFEKSMLLWNIPLLGMAVLLFSLRVFDVVTNNFTFEIGLALFGIDIAAVIVNFIKSQTKKPDLTSFVEQSYVQLTKKVEEINRNYKERGITFKVNKKIFWVDIILD